jgi:hypothetical protein
MSNIVAEIERNYKREKGLFEGNASEYCVVSSLRPPQTRTLELFGNFSF